MNQLRSLTLVAVLFLAACSQMPSQYDLSITNVTLIDGTGSPAQENVNVYVRDGRIQHLTSTSLSVTTTSRIDGTGKFLMPGLIDGHAHPSPVQQNFPIFVQFGVTSVFVPGCGTCSKDVMTEMRRLSEDQTLPAPRVVHTSPHFTMRGRHPVKSYPGDHWVHGKTVYYVDNEQQIAGFISEVALEPIVGIKVTIEEGPTPPYVERMPVELIARIVKEAHRQDLKVYAHVSDMTEVAMAEAAGVDHIIHFVGVDIDWTSDLEVIERLQRRKPGWVTTLMLDKSFFYPSHPHWLSAVEELGFFDQMEIDRLRGTASSPLSEIYGHPDPMLESVIAAQMDDLRRLHEMGFDLVVGTDTGNDYIFPGLSMHEEMELLGMTFHPLEIIKMATRNAAKMLDRLDDLGTLEVGKLADMVLLNRDPAQDIRNTRAIDSVFIGGERKPMLTP